MNSKTPASTTLKSKGVSNNMKWHTIKGERGVQRRSDGQYYRLRFTKTLIGSNGEPVLVVSKNGKQRPKRIEFIEHFNSKKEAIAAKADRETKFLNGGKEALDAEKITFAQLADEYETNYLIEPVYDDPDSDERHKQAGIVSVGDGKRAMKLFRDYFGNRLIKTITADEIKKWKLARLKTPKERGGGQRTIASVHHDLRFLRQAFNFAIRQGWCERNPFTGAKLINPKQERQRHIAITFAQENRLLESINDPLLKMLVVFLLDSGLRLSESLQVTRGMIDLGVGTYGHISLPARITKERKNRDLPVLSKRLRRVLEKRFNEIPNDPKALLFGADWQDRRMRDEWEAAVKRANLDALGGRKEALRKHDLRHTWITRAVPSGIPLPEAMKYSGHKEIETFLLYVNPTQQSHDINTAKFEAYATAGSQVQEAMASVN